MKAYTVICLVDGFAVARLDPMQPEDSLELPGPLVVDVARAILADLFGRPALLHEVVSFEHFFLPDLVSGKTARSKTILEEEIRLWARVRGFGPHESPP